MKIKSIVLTLVLSLLAIAGIASANTGLQNTPYATQQFSAVFDGPVEVEAMQRSADGQSSNYSYFGHNGTVGQTITVRFVDHDIAVDFTSSDFYADDDKTGGVVENRSTGMWQGHPFTYTRRHYTDQGVELSKRTCYIIVNKREVIFVVQIAPYQIGPEGTPDQPQWYDFVYSLNIN